MEATIRPVTASKPMCRALVHKWHWERISPSVPVLRRPSGNAEAGHAVDHLAGDPGLDLLGGQTPGSEAPADQNLVPMESGFHECPLAIASHGLPAHSAFPGEHPDVPVALSGSVAAVSSTRRRRR
jgi:hypothetical protein